MELTIKGTQEEIKYLLQIIISDPKQVVRQDNHTSGTSIFVGLTFEYPPISKDTNIFTGLMFPSPPISKEDFINLYDDYVRRTRGS